MKNLIVLTVLLVWMPALHAAEPDKPNVLFIAVDDLRCELGCYGAKEIKSPNIDRLAKRGVVFDLAYCQQAVCNPSRVSLMTGMRPDSTKVWDLVTDFRTTIPNAVTIPQHFRKHRYRALSYGKIFHNEFPDNVSWDEPHRWPENSQLWSEEAKRRLTDFRQEMRAEGKGEAAIERMRAVATEIVDIPDSKHIDGAIADQAIAAMRRLAKNDQPFFLAAGFIRPHLPFVVPRKYWELYDRDEIPLAANSFLPHGMPEMAFGDHSLGGFYELRVYMDYLDTPSPFERPLTDAQKRELKHGYYASVSFIDEQVGRLLAELDRLGLAQNTVVVLWGDHGWKLGEHNGWCKQTNYEVDTRVPLIICAPGAKANGKSSGSLVEFVDIYPTLCELAGLPVPGFAEGTSLAPLLDDVSAKVKDAAYSQFPRNHQGRNYMGYAMRTDRYRFIEWLDRQTGKTVATELYDHTTDPNENTNIADRPESRETVTTLHERLQRVIPRPLPKQPPSPVKRPLLKILNQRSNPVVVYWVTSEGRRLKRARLAPGQTHTSNTTIGHRFVVEDEDGRHPHHVVVTKDGQVEMVTAAKPQASASKPRPNMVFFMADDWSWPHAGFLGDPVAKTPNIDRIAREGVTFDNAFVSVPSCTPSRLSILTGQHHWRLKEGDSLGGSLREEYDVYSEMLQAAGYRVGWFGKGVWPSEHKFRNRDSFGPRFPSFDEFIKDRTPGEPFCFWHGGLDPHRPYEYQVGVKSGIKLADIKVPACLPDNETVRSDLADYYWEVGRFDREVGQVLAKLEAMGELDNTIIVVSGDHGMPFPRCKGTLYDLGTRVPLAVRWVAKVKGNRRVTDFVSLCDFAPTFLETAGLKAGKDMTGRSLLPLLTSDKSGQIDPDRTFVLTGLEQHVYPNPSRALRTRDYLYIRNFNPEKWPTGEAKGENLRYDFANFKWPSVPEAFSFNYDPSPTKQFLRFHRNDEGMKRFADLAFGRHPEEELYDLRKDPDQLRNVASDVRYAAQRREIRDRLDSELRKAGDPRCAAHGEPDSKPSAANTAPSAAERWKVQPPPPNLKAPSFYRKYVDADGYPILASERVNDYALKEAAFLVTKLLAHRPDVKRAMVASGSRLVILAHDEFTTDLPEFAHFEPKDYWDVRARGTGGSQTDPYCSCGEENLLGYPGDPYPTENILVHESAHNIHLRGMVNTDPTFDERVKKANEKAMAKGLWKGKYASVNHHEYFAEGVQSWFDNNRENDHDHNHVNTRRELIDYDPGLAALCREVFGDTKLVYTKPATRLVGHLAGYDRSQAPRFVWPKRLDAVRAQILADAKNREQQHDADRDHEQSPVTNDSDSSKP